LNLFNSQKKTEMFIFTSDGNLYVSVQGLTFNDIIYEHRLSEKQLEISLNQHYQAGVSHVDSKIVESGPDLKSYLRNNTEIYRVSRNKTSTPKMFFSEQYETGDICAVTGKPRRIKVFYFCDEYAGTQQIENEKLSRSGYNHLEQALKDFTKLKRNVTEPDESFRQF
jgi:hypothetical protein